MTRCSLCGGENEVLPGQKMLVCSYCGSALGLGGSHGPEHLILPHEKNESAAEAVLRSFLAERRLARPSDIKVEFMYVPYVIVEDGRGGMLAAPSRGAPSWASGLPFPPAGDYSFFKEEYANGEKVIPFSGTDDKILRILHIPVYHFRYRAAGKKWDAAVFGESMLVTSGAFPPSRPGLLSIPNILGALALFTLFLFIGRFGAGFAGRFLLVAIAALAGYAAFSIRERITGRAE